VNNVINTSGIIMARSVSEQGGEIVLDGGDQGVVKVTGTLDASGKNEGEKGGRVIVTGEKVGLFEQAKLDVSGDAGGGRALVGGDYMGGKGDPAKIAAYKIKMEDGPVRNAQFAYVAEGATINADALRSGDGGKAVVWADQATRMYGSILARGGSQSGNGGFIETSGKEFLDVGKAADASAAKGQGGTWLLDPRNVEIKNAVTSNGSYVSSNPDVFAPSGDTSVIDRAAIQASLNAGTSVTVNTGTTGSQAGDITVTDSITKTVAAGSHPVLKLDAYGDINVNAVISNTAGFLGLEMYSANGNINANTVNTGVNWYVVLDGYRNISFGNGTFTGASLNVNARGGKGAGTITVDLAGGDQMHYSHNGTRATIPTNGIALDNFTNTVRTRFYDLSVGYQNNSVRKVSGTFEAPMNGSAFGATQAPDGTPEFRLNGFYVNYNSHTSDLYALEAQNYTGGAVTLYPFPSTSTTTSTSTTKAKNQHQSQISKKPGTTTNTTKKPSDENPDEFLPYGPKLPDGSFYFKDSERYKQIERNKHNIDFFDKHMNDLLVGDTSNLVAVSAFKLLIEAGQYGLAQEAMNRKYGQLAGNVLMHFLKGKGSDLNVNLNDFITSNPGAYQKIVSEIKDANGKTSGSINLSQKELESSEWIGALGSVQINWSKVDGKTVIAVNENYSWNPKKLDIDSRNVTQNASGDFFYKDGSGNLLPCAKIDGVFYDKRDTYPLYKVMNEKIINNEAKEFKIRGETVIANM
jgi:hypothetical protein